MSRHYFKGRDISNVPPSSCTGPIHPSLRKTRYDPEGGVIPPGATSIEDFEFQLSKFADKITETHFWHTDWDNGRDPITAVSKSFTWLLRHGLGIEFRHIQRRQADATVTIEQLLRDTGTDRMGRRIGENLRST